MKVKKGLLPSFIRQGLRGTLFLCLMMAGGYLFGQSVPQYSLYMLNRYQFNPAYAGMDASLSINGSYRTQWLNIQGNPEQKHINAHMPLYIASGAVGIALSHETIGAEGTLNASLSYNYVHETDYGLFSAGLSAGIIQKSLDGALLRTPGGDYEGPTIIHNDPDLPVSMVRSIAPQFSAGLYYVGPLFEAGISVTDYTAGTLDLAGSNFKGRAAVTAFGEYFIENLDVVSIYPTFLLRTDLVQTQFEASVRAEYEEFLTGGLGIRGYNHSSLDAVIVFAGLKLSEHLSLAYAFDITVSALNQASRGSHEVVLRYNLKKIIGAGLPPPVIYSPRFY